MERHDLALAFTCAILASTCGTGCDSGVGDASALDAPVVGIVWRLTNVSKAGEGTRDTPPGTFTLELRENGELHLVADCNICNGRYALGEFTFQVEGGLLACTRAACASSPFDTEYTALVAGARTWEGDTANLSLFGDASQLRFERDRP